ncbi:MAG: KOW motif-containing protein [Acidobacteria bacterium]|nr:KOW motif-containing protein [Acidobacteriota bacterium]
MPILEREPDCWPENIFEMPTEEMPWQVVYVRSRQEKNLARLLRGRAPVYLPQWENRNRRSARGSAWLPVFPGYVFFRGHREEKLAAQQSNLLVAFLPIEDQDRLQKELSQLHALKEQGGYLRPWPEPVVGDEVTISEGAFAGYRGVVKKINGGRRMIISVTALNQAVSVDLDREAVRPKK